jgi:hypothetical protein
LDIIIIYYSIVITTHSYVGVGVLVGVTLGVVVLVGVIDGVTVFVGVLVGVTVGVGVGGGITFKLIEPPLNVQVFVPPVRPNPDIVLLLYVDVPDKGELDIYPVGTQTSPGFEYNKLNPNESPLNESAKLVTEPGPILLVPDIVLYAS